MCVCCLWHFQGCKRDTSIGGLFRPRLKRDGFHWLRWVSLPIARGNPFSFLPRSHLCIYIYIPRTPHTHFSYGMMSTLYKKVIYRGKLGSSKHSLKKGLWYLEVTGVYVYIFIYGCVFFVVQVFPNTMVVLQFPKTRGTTCSKRFDSGR